MKKREIAKELLADIAGLKSTRDHSVSGNDIEPRMWRLLRDTGAVKVETQIGANGYSEISITSEGKMLLNYLNDGVLENSENWGNADIAKWHIILMDYPPAKRSSRNILSEVERHCLYYAWNGSKKHRQVIECYGGSESRALITIGNGVKSDSDLRFSGYDISDTMNHIENFLSDETGLSRKSLERLGLIALYRIYANGA